LGFADFVEQEGAAVSSPTVREGAAGAPSLTVGLLTPQAVIQILVRQAYSSLKSQPCYRRPGIAESSDCAQDPGVLRD